MLLNQWTVLLPKDLEWADIDPSNGICLDFRNNFDVSPNYLRAITKFTKGRYVVLLMSEQTLQSFCEQETYSALITIFFCSSYYREQNSPVLFMDSEGGDINPHLLEYLKTKVQKQGFNQLIIKKVIHPCRTVPEFNLFHSPNLQYDMLLSQWISQVTRLKKVIPIHIFLPGLPCSNNEIFDEAKSQINSISSLASYPLAAHLFDCHLQIDNLNQKMNRLKENESNSEVYLELQKKNLGQALDWYHYEYEILPLWYKQLGHILKVMMGKRTFRSLFNDRAKKYIH
jgi:hypothetical protein